MGANVVISPNGIDENILKSFSVDFRDRMTFFLKIKIYL